MAPHLKSPILSEPPPETDHPPRAEKQFTAAHITPRYEAVYRQVIAS